MDQTIVVGGVDEKTSSRDASQKTAANAGVSIAGCALATFVFGAVLDAAWPAAVAACGISAMGIGVVYVLSKSFCARIKSE
jgi:putative flippase GtrA